MKMSECQVLWIMTLTGLIFKELKPRYCVMKDLDAAQENVLIKLNCVMENLIAQTRKMSRAVKYHLSYK